MLRLAVFLLFFAAVIYALFWLLERRGGRTNRGDGGSGGPRGAGRPPGPRGPLGPDDDEDFLRELDRKRRHRQDHGPDDDA